MDNSCPPAPETLEEGTKKVVGVVGPEGVDRDDRCHQCHTMRGRLRRKIKHSEMKVVMEVESCGGC